MTDASAFSGERLEMKEVRTMPVGDDARHESSEDYTAVVYFDVPPEVVFEALTTAEGISGWWASASGSGSEGGELRFHMGYEDPLIIRVDQAQRASTVNWTVLACSFMSDWLGTRPSFALAPHGATGCELRFRHHGLTPQLECFELCRPNWDHYLLSSLHDYVESGRGRPLGSGANGAEAGH